MIGAVGKRLCAQPHRLIFLDETGTNTRMTREYGRSLRGERLKGSAPFRRRGNQTLIAGLSYDGIVAPWVISGAMDRDAFDTYIEKVLIPELEPGSVVILDNLATHKSDHAAQMLGSKAHGCWFLFLIPELEAPGSRQLVMPRQAPHGSPAPIRANSRRRSFDLRRIGSISMGASPGSSPVQSEG